MVNGYDQSRRSRYDKPNQYEKERKSADASPPTPIQPIAVAKPPIDQFQPRNLPTAIIYTPDLGESRQGRRDARRLIGDLHIASQVHEAASGYEGSLTKLEETHQNRELVQLRRTQLPAKIEQENLSIAEQVVRGRTAFEAAVEQQQDERAHRSRGREIDQEDFETVRANRRASRLQAQAREKESQEYLAHAAEIGRRQAEAELHKAAEKSHRKEADAEAERRRRNTERQKRQDATTPAGPDMPAPLAAHYATERKVRSSRKRANELEAEMRQDAAAAGRELTDGEVEDIDALRDASAGAEDTIRRGDATDFTV